MTGEVVLRGNARDDEFDLVLCPAIDPAHGAASTSSTAPSAFVRPCTALHPLYLLLDPAGQESRSADADYDYAAHARAVIDLGPLAARAILAAHEPVVRSVMRAQANSERLIEA